MNVEEALEIVQTVTDTGSLSKVQEIVFRHCWEKQSYMEIAITSGYEVGYIRDVGCKLWQSLSKALGKKVTKNNFYGVLKHQYTAMFAEPRMGKKWQQFPGNVPGVLTAEERTDDPHQDWGDAVDVSDFYGRTAELSVLNQWIVPDRCRLVLLLGMGGIGKTSLAVKIAEQVQDEFKYLIWRSLRNAPPIKALIAELIQFFSHQQEVELPESLDGLLSRLMAYLRQNRCLLVLDNCESILRGGERAGRYCAGYEGYSELLRRIADERHQSCLILTSREKPIGLTAKEGKTLPVRSLQLTGLPQVEAKKILKDKGIVEIEDESKKLIEYYNGNPLALKIAATTIQSLFSGDVFKFLEQGTVIFGDIWELLDQQFNRLSALEKQVMYWLASNRKWVTLPELREDCFATVSHRELLEALESLQQRSLIERHSASFMQQSVIMEYMSVRGIAKLIYS
jgi:hypothetical protein